MTSSAKMKDNMIRDYISKINFKDNNVSVKALKEDLRQILKEVPGVMLDWKREEQVNEILGEKKQVEFIKSITIAFTDGERDGIPIVEKVTYYV